eukprot:8639395-Pyramimonas_sp.AAC.1
MATQKVPVPAWSRIPPDLWAWVIYGGLSSNPHLPLRGGMYSSPYAARWIWIGRQEDPQRARRRSAKHQRKVRTPVPKRAPRWLQEGPKKAPRGPPKSQKNLRHRLHQV